MTTNNIIYILDIDDAFFSRAQEKKTAAKAAKKSDEDAFFNTDSEKAKVISPERKSKQDAIDAALKTNIDGVEMLRLAI